MLHRFGESVQELPEEVRPAVWRIVTDLVKGMLGEPAPQLPPKAVAKGWRVVQ